MEFLSTFCPGQAIYGGELAIGVSYVGVPVHTEKFDICDKVSCPAKGNFLIPHTQTLPAFTPPVSFTISYIHSAEYILKMSNYHEIKLPLSSLGASGALILKCIVGVSLFIYFILL